MTSPAQKLRALIESKEHFIAADAYSALTARIVEKVGFKAAYLGGHACSAFHYAVPDNGIFSQVEQIEQSGRIAAAIDIPLIADADTLGETVADAYHFARRYTRAGIAGIHVEDEVNPKHSTFENGLCSTADMQFRIEACARGRGGDAMVIIARCDELYVSKARGGGGGSMEEAIARGRAYAEAGADVMVYPGTTPADNATLMAALPIPVCVLGPVVPGTAFALHTGWGWMGAAELHLERATELMDTGKVTMGSMFPRKAEFIEQAFYDGLIAEWATKTGRKTR
jgi:2-methylisocitrate lyase-like PEP mutase family enzyme